MDIGRVEGHSSRLLAAIAAGVQGRRDRWLWALGLQLPPGPHSPVVHLQQDQHQGDNDDDNHHNGSHDGSRALIQGVLSPGHVQREDGVPQSGGCGHLAPAENKGELLLTTWIRLSVLAPPSLRFLRHEREEAEEENAQAEAQEKKDEAEVQVSQPVSFVNT